MMNIAFIHYHLKTGGVTSVLKQQVETLRDVCDILVITGVLAESPFPSDMVHIPELGYDKAGAIPEDPEDVAESVCEAIFSKWKDGCDVIHVHNATLAKNRNFLKILKVLQKKGMKLFLQLHDFAEDGRPLAYFPDEYVPDCHYGVINSRDYNILLKAGLKKDGLHKIFNIVNFFDFRQKELISENLVLYPIRAIRRKNIGEAILLSLFFRNNETLAMTQPPNSPPDIESYDGWKNYVRKNNLDVVFEAGLTNDFESLVLSSEFIITTSITEGFGFSFLEPWTAKKMLWGRKLPDICEDFEKNGVQLDHLYTKLNIPIGWTDISRFHKKRRSCILQACCMFQHSIDETHIAESFNFATQNGVIDFGLLDESFQKQVISHTLSRRQATDTLIRLNPFLSFLGNASDKAVLTESNRKAVTSHYNQEAYRELLLDIYSKVVRHPVRQRIDKKRLLDRFFDLNRFSLLKWGNYAG